jgi:preprotein translocase subunit SecA
MIRLDKNDSVYTTEKGKFLAVADEVERCHKSGQPVLVGTVSVEKSEHVSRLLENRGVPHVVLHAKFHEKEAEIIAQAARRRRHHRTNMAAAAPTSSWAATRNSWPATAEAAGHEETLIEEAIGHAEKRADEVKKPGSASGELYAQYARRPTAST